MFFKPFFSNDVIQEFDATWAGMVFQVSPARDASTPELLKRNQYVMTR